MIRENLLLKQEHWWNSKSDLREDIVDFDKGYYSSPEKFFPSSKSQKRRRRLVKLKNSVQALDFLTHNAG